MLEEFCFSLPEKFVMASSEIVALQGIADSPQDLPQYFLCYRKYSYRPHHPEKLYYLEGYTLTQVGSLQSAPLGKPQEIQI